MMSSASSIVHGIGSVVSRDLVGHIKPEWEDKQVLVARIMIMITIFAAFLLSLADISLLLTSGGAAASLACSLGSPPGRGSGLRVAMAHERGSVCREFPRPGRFSGPSACPPVHEPIRLLSGRVGVDHQFRRVRRWKSGYLLASR